MLFWSQAYLQAFQLINREQMPNETETCFARYVLNYRKKTNESCKNLIAMFISKLYLSQNVYLLKGAAPNSAAFEIVFGLIRGIGIKIQFN